MSLNEGGGVAALHLAVIKGNKAMIELLIDAGAKLDIQNGLGQTPLHLAALLGNAEVTELLLQRGAEKEAKDFTHGASPLHYACCESEKEAAAVLLKAGADLTAMDDNDQTPLDWLFNPRDLEVPVQVFEMGAVPEGRRSEIPWAQFLDGTDEEH